MDAIEILARLVSFKSVVSRPNGPIAGWIRDYLAGLGAEVHLIEGPEGDRVNLFASFGPRARRGWLLSGHMDVVPADEDGWSSDPFRLAAHEDRLVGRGACDMKGFLACALAAAPHFARAAGDRPIHLAFSYDEEAGCRGVPHLIARLPQLCAKPLGCIVGEPTGLVPVRGHKGKASARITLHGRSGHSSRPELGLNAIHGLSPILDRAVGEAERLSGSGRAHPDYTPPHSTMQVGMLGGGRALNVIPDRATLEIEARTIPGDDAKALLHPVMEAAEDARSRGYEVSAEIIASYPPLALREDAPLARQLELLTGRRPLPAVSYGTEAGLFQAAGHDAIICGPGGIDRAHKPAEWIGRNELAECLHLLEKLPTTEPVAAS